MTLHAHQSESDAPYWMKAKKDGKCAECRAEIYEGDKIVWDPKEYKAYCETCGEDVML